MTRRRAVLVVGMHRSGTSALARALSLHGLALPRTPMGPGPGNELGHWGESERIHLAHDKMLAAAGTSWDDPSPLPESWRRSPAGLEYRAKLAKIVLDEYPGHEPFVLKDPRICRLIPFWLDVLADVGVEAAFAIPIRNPLEVAASLNQRDGVPQAKGLLLWLRHVLEAERDTRGQPRSFVGYSTLLRDWQGTMRAISSDLDLAWPRTSHGVTAELERFLSPEHRHHRFSRGELNAREDIVEWVKDAHAVFRRAIKKGKGPDGKRLDALREAVDAADLAYGPLLAHERLRAAEFQSVLATAEGDLKAQKGLLTEKEARLQEHETRLEELEAARSELESNVHAAEKSLAERDEQLVALKDERSRLEAERQRLQEALSREAEKAAAAKAALRDREAELASLRTEIARRDARLELLEAERGRLAAEAREAAVSRKEIERLRQELRRTHDQVLELRRNRIGYRLKTAWLQRRARAAQRRRSISQMATWILKPSSPGRLRNIWEFLALRRSPHFDRAFYLQRNPDVASAGMNPVLHYIEYGAAAGLDPSPSFSTKAYLAAHPEIAAKGVNPLYHFQRTGARAPHLSPAATRSPKESDGESSTSPGPAAHIPASRRSEHELRETLRAGAPAGFDRGPMVSIVVPNRDGGKHLERLLPALERTSYEPFELILVDNGSSDASARLAREANRSFPVTVIDNDVNRSFSAAINQGAEASRGELVLLLNNDVEPIAPGWLGSMVETMREREAACVGARLIYPRRVGLDNEGDDVFPDLTLQHRGIHFVSDPAGIPRPRHLGTGGDPLSVEAGAIREVPAVTAACMLIDRDAFEALGGLDEEYRYGTEDVDLCLRLGERGERIVYDGRVALFHHEFGTQNAAGRAAKRENRINNRRLFVERWGPSVSRRVLADRLRGDGYWSEQPLRVGITLTRDDEGSRYGDFYTAHELGDELARLGFEVIYLEMYREGWRQRIDEVDVLISLLDRFPLHEAPPGVVSIAWIRNWTHRWIERPWFEDYDIVLASSERSRKLIEAGTAQVAQLMPLATNPRRFRPLDPDPAFSADVAFTGNRWGDERGIEAILPGLSDRFDVKVYGAGWDAVPSMNGFACGPVPYETLPAVYSSARLVVDDSQYPTRPYGSVNSRVFDALASGTLVVSNDDVGVRELFGDEFPVWTDEESLKRHATMAVEAPEDVTGLAERFRTEVIAHHTYRHRAEQVRDALLEWCHATRFGVAIGVPDREQARNWGDYHFARSVQRQLHRRGHPTRVHLLPNWEQEHMIRDDVLLHLYGLSTLPRLAGGQLKVIWNISHPELVTPELLDEYDLALIASPDFAARLAEHASTPVKTLNQATDPARFFPDPAEHAYELLFVGNSRKVRRPVVAAAARSGLGLTVYGADWTPDLLDPVFLAGTSVPNSELRRHYSGAKIVLNDHWPDMRESGFISNRIYDALACGACVVSDHVEGIEEEFEGAVATFIDAGELPVILERLLADPDERRERGERGRSVVLDRHTFEHRVEKLLGWVEAVQAERLGKVSAG